MVIKVANVMYLPFTVHMNSPPFCSLSLHPLFPPFILSRMTACHYILLARTDN